jgi:acetyl-CoA carboxylase carboxyl transferase subunit beta
MSWIDKIKEKTGIGPKATKPKESLIECKKCKEQTPALEIAQNLHVCPKCDYHFRIGALERINQLLNPDSFVQHDQNLVSTDPLKFKDKRKYKERIKSSTKSALENEALVSGSGLLEEHPLEICAFNFFFMGGSMGSVVGEKVTRSIERTIKNESALVVVNCSGGARMQEGILSLMQMAKTSSALEQLAERNLPYISVLADPTTGGVSASFAMLGDIILAEPGALIGFAGPRVIEQTINQKLPKGFQSSDFLLKHGLIDQVVHRNDLRSTINQILTHLKKRPTTMIDAEEVISPAS